MLVRLLDSGEETGVGGLWLKQVTGEWTQPAARGPGSGELGGRGILFIGGPLCYGLWKVKVSDPICCDADLIVQPDSPIIAEFLCLPGAMQQDITGISRIMQNHNFHY